MGEKKTKKEKKSHTVSFLFFLFFFIEFFSSPLVHLHLFLDIIIAFSISHFRFSFPSFLYTLQIYAFFSYILCTQQTCQVHFISVWFVSFLVPEKRACTSRHNISYHMYLFFILRSTVYRVHHHHTEYNIGWPICAH